MAFLADGNVLIALTVADHVHHGPATSWFAEVAPELATTPVTEGTLLRFLIREGLSAHAAIGVLDAMRSRSWHRFWPDDVPYEAGQLSGVIGHRQVTDAHLVALARHNRGQVATLDRGLAALHPDVAHLVPTP